MAVLAACGPAGDTRGVELGHGWRSAGEGVGTVLCGLDVVEAPVNPPADACREGDVVLGPHRLTRDSGPPAEQSWAVDLPSGGPACISIETAPFHEAGHASAAWVFWNDGLVASPSRFSAGRVVIESRLSVSEGPSTLGSRLAGSPGDWIELTLKTGGEGERGGVVGNRHLELFNLYADRPVLTPGLRAVHLTAQGTVLRFVKPDDDCRPEHVVRWSFEIRSTESCELVNVLEGESVVTPDAPSFGMAAAWDGRDATGALLPRGEYLYRAVAALFVACCEDGDDDDCDDDDHIDDDGCDDDDCDDDDCDDDDCDNDDCDDDGCADDCDDDDGCDDDDDCDDCDDVDDCDNDDDCCDDGTGHGGSNRWRYLSELATAQQPIIVRRLLTNIDIDKTHGCPGESFRVEVDAERPEGFAGRMDVSIQGVPGALRYLQFTGPPGPRLIHVGAGTSPEGHVDGRVVEVELVACPEDQDPYPLVYARSSRYHLHTAEFGVLNAEDYDVEGVTYRWEFGDGQEVETTVPFVTHDYSASVIRDEPYTVFQARVTIGQPGEPEIATPKTVTVFNNYARLKQRGLIELRVENAPRLQMTSGVARGELRVTNLEEEALVLTERRLEFAYCDPDALAFVTDPEPVVIIVPGLTTTTVRVDVVSPPTDVCSLGVHLSGTSADGLEVHADGYFLARENPAFGSIVADPELSALLTELSERGLVADPSRITDEDLHRLSRSGLIPEVHAPAPSAGGLTFLSAVLGEECDIGATDTGYVCQATGEWRHYQAWLDNAFKGDIVIATGCGMITNLLGQMSPPQVYNHEGLMTGNHWQITHNTAEQKQIEAQIRTDPAFPDILDVHVEADVMRYGWPGALHQSVDEAFNGVTATDPYGDEYLLDLFNPNSSRCDGHELYDNPFVEEAGLVEPRVIKPRHDAPEALREFLFELANDAKEARAHYRWYAYSHAMVVDDPDYHHEGTPPAQSVSYVWRQVRNLTWPLEGTSLEDGDELLDAELPGVDPGFDSPNDGLYRYSEAERINAAFYLWSFLRNRVLSEDHAAHFEAALGFTLLDPTFNTLAADEVANQFVNCLGWDLCGNTGPHWRTGDIGDGVTVSAQDMFFWDAWYEEDTDGTGLYGHEERLRYRASHYAPVGRWAPASGTGTVTGTVTYEGAALEGVQVRFTNLDVPSKVTGADGRFAFFPVPGTDPNGAGHVIEASATVDDGCVAHSFDEVVVRDGETTEIELPLEIDATAWRVTIDGDLEISDDEGVYGDHNATYPFHRQCNVSEADPHDAIELWTHCHGGQVRVDLFGHCDLRPDGSVDVQLIGTLWEWWNCTRTDAEDTKVWGLTVPPEGQVPLHVYLFNSEVAGGDYVIGTLEVTNELAACESP